MAGNLGKIVVGLTVLTAVAAAEAGGRVVYTTNFPTHYYYSPYVSSYGGFAPYYSGYVPYYVPQAVLPAPASTSPAPASAAPASGNGVTATEFQRFVTQYNRDIGDIKTKLGIPPVPANPGGTVNGSGGPTTQPGGPQPGTAVAPQAAPANAPPDKDKTSVQRLDRVIQQLEAIKIDR
jgi:hypothetical protein